MRHGNVERFAAMGTRVELHRFGSGDRDALVEARRAIEAVDDALTIHRPSATTALNEQLMAGRSAVIENRLLSEALDAVAVAYALTGGLFDPTVVEGATGGGWPRLRFDPDNARIEVTQPLALDFGGIGKGFALDRGACALRSAGVTSAFLSAGESSIAVIGQHPLGGAWPVTMPHPSDPRQVLVELALEDEAMSVSSSIGGGAARAATVRPRDGSAVAEACTTVVVAQCGALAEAMSTALLAANAAEARRLIAAAPAARHRFDHEPLRLDACA